jgi:hypothetical protein
MGLREYMARMDGPEPMTALECMDPDVHFLIALPSGEVTGTSRSDFETYIAGRQPVDRVHHVLRYQVDADTELLYGYVTDAGQLMGTFLSAAVLTSTGAIRRYQTFFHTGFQLLDFQGSSS